jgi:hypothetical protein
VPRIRFTIPYRGQPRPEYPQPRRQIRNLRGEKEHYLFSAVVLIVFSFLVLGVGIADYLLEHSGIALFIFILVFLILITFSLSAMDGMRSIDKFRPGYDIDTSEQPEIEQHAHHYDHDIPSISG